jgi:SAM-dependent methyltransferase
MRKLTLVEEIIWNHGERLIPGVTHNQAEVIRHMSSYLFFRKIIESDLLVQRKRCNPIQIVDLGCGVGYGCRILSKIKGAHILGVDISPETLSHAQDHYLDGNINYQLADLADFIPRMPKFDYVISRGVFEHIPNGLDLAFSTNWQYRLLFDVPHNEPKGRNPYHVLYQIREQSFSRFPETELFFQDLDGIIYDTNCKPSHPNMIICVCSDSKLPKVESSKIEFPFRGWELERNAVIKKMRWKAITQWIAKNTAQVLHKDDH